MEECFALIQLQITEARLEKDSQKVNDLLKVQYFLIAFFVEVLSEFRDYYILSPTMLDFGKILYNERPMIITFNYDLFIESVIEHASGIKFDKVLLHDGSMALREKYFDKSTFYSNNKNKLYPWSILKLHGSLNWYRYVNDTPNRYISQKELEQLYESKKKQIVLQNLEWFLPISETPYNEDQLFVEPIIITPVLHKQFYDEKFVYKKVFDPLWRKAKSSLLKCKSLILIGYSLPATDFHTRKLFLEAFANNIVNELIIVNPDSNAIEETKRLKQFKEIRIFKNLDIYYYGLVRLSLNQP